MPSPADLHKAVIEPGSPGLQEDSLPTKLSGRPNILLSSLNTPSGSWSYLEKETIYRTKSTKCHKTRFLFSFGLQYYFT